MSYAKEIFYHIRQVAARIAKLVLGVHLRPQFWEEEVVGVSDGTISKSDGGFL